MISDLVLAAQLQRHTHIGVLLKLRAFQHAAVVQVFKKKDADADELMGLSSLKRSGKKTKKGAEKGADKPVSLGCLSLYPS